MSSRRLATALAAAALLSSVSVAAADPIETRQALMSANGAAAKAAGEMAKGNIDFNTDVAALALATFAAVSLSFREFFPEGSETGHDTRAKAAIWEDRAGFMEANEAFAEDAAAAVAAKPADLDAFKAAFGSVAENCKACHEKYRAPKN